MNRKSRIFRGVAGIMVFVLLISMTATTITFQYDGVINSVLGTSTSEVVETSDGEAVETTYYTSEYGTDYTNGQSALALEMDVAQEQITQVEEGTVLLKNENDALPLAEGAGVTLFGKASATSTSSTITSIEGVTLASGLQEALGEENVNTALIDNVYSTMMESTSTSEVVEADIEDVKAYEDTWQDSCNDAAIVVFTRSGGEGSDLAMTTSEGRHYLGLSENEEALMEYLQEQKEAGVFGSIIVLISCDFQMELDWLDEYGVDAALIIGSVGPVGYTGVANILTGETNPSGHLTDTYASNSLSSPAVTYAAENTLTWSNVDEVNEYCDDDMNDGEYIDYYIIYAEGIYVGYKYYETRYEDVVMGEGGAEATVGSTNGDAWDYSDEVVYTFGYGLSYTTFDQTLDSVEYDEETDTYNVSVTVTNTGSVAGMDAVEVYAQTPYGDYEKENLVEKSSVVLVGFAKTDELEPGESQTVTVEVDAYMLASYDSNGAEGYILSAGDYYLAIGDDSHDALNNILAAKGYTTANGMTEDGDASNTYTWTQDELDTETYSTSVYTDVEVTNVFDDADINYYGYDFTYLTRQDWEGTYPEEAVSIEATTEIMDALDGDWYESDESVSVDDFTQGVDNGISFVDMYGVDYDDDEAWDAFIDQLTIEEMAELTTDAHGVGAIDELGIPSQIRNDDGINGNTLLSTGETSLSWCSETVTGRTWNTERYTMRGYFRGLEAAFCGTNELWYGAGNIHRTPFGGRAAQYFSEDGNFGYIAAYYEAQAMQSVGVNYCVKHMAMNDQETSRESVATFATEQTIREEYLRPFEGAFAGGAQAVMTSFNRIGCTYAGNSKALLTTVLRGEWGFEGHVTTDGFSSADYKTHYLETIDAGVDYLCLDSGLTSAALQEAIAEGDGYALQILRNATKNNLYAAVNSISSNGLSSTTEVITIVPWWQKALLITTAVSAVALIVCVIGFTVTARKEKKSKATAAKGDR